MSDLNLAIIISAVDQASSVLGPLGSTLAGLVSTLASFGAKTVQMAGDFQQGMTSLVTGAGEAQSNLAAVSNGILNLATQTGTSTQQLTDGMYMIESAGYHGAAGLQVLQAAAEGAKVGNADLGVVANAVTTVLTDYHLSSDQAVAATNALITTVADGKTHLQDLAGAMGSVLPLASSLGISFGQVGGAIATMTNAGMDAQRASMNLANAIRALAAPNATAQKAMKEVGLSAQQLKDTLSQQGLTGAIQLIEEHVGQTFPAGSVQAVEAFKALMGGATGYNVALMLGGQNMTAFENNVKGITAAMNAGGTAVQGWDLVQQDFNFKLAQAQQALNVLMIRIGSAFLPVLMQLLNLVTPIITAFTDWIQHSGVVNVVMAAIQQTVLAMLPGLKTFWQQLVDIVDQVIAWATQNDVLQQVLHVVTLTSEIFWDVVRGALPLLENLFLQVLGVVSSFETWAVQSGFLQQVINAVTIIVGIFQGALQILTTVILPVVEGFVNWILQSGILQTALTLTGQGVQTLGKWMQGGLPTIQNFGEQVGKAADAVLGLSDATNKANATPLNPPQKQKGASSGIGAQGSSGNIATASKQNLNALQQMAQFLGNVFSPLWKTWADLINKQVIPAWNNFVKAIGPIMPELQLAWKAVEAMAMTIYDEIVRVGADLIKSWLETGAGLWNATLGFGKAILGAVAAIVDAIQGNWQAFQRDLGVIWGGLVQIGQGVWQAIKAQFDFWSNAVQDVASNFLSDLLKNFEALSDDLVGHSVVPDMINAILAWFQYLLTAGPNLVSRAASLIAGVFTGLANQASSFGQNLVQGFINGINGMLGNVASAASGIASTVKQYLGFASPAERGPGAHLMEWGPGLISGFAEGITQSIPLVESAVNLAVAPVARLTAPAPLTAPASARSGAGLASSISVTVNAPARSRNEAEAIAQTVVEHLSRSMRRSGGLATMTSGGRAS